MSDLLKRPTEQDAARAKQVARDRGWLSDKGFIWDRPWPARLWFRFKRWWQGA